MHTQKCLPFLIHYLFVFHVTVQHFAGSGDPDGFVLFEDKNVAPAQCHVGHIVKVGDFFRFQTGKTGSRFGRNSVRLSPVPECAIIGQCKAFTEAGGNFDDFSAIKRADVDGNGMRTVCDRPVAYLTARVVTPCQ